MNEENTKTLITKYPKIFSREQKFSLIGFGFTCNDGWFNLIDTLCDFLQFHTDRNKRKQAVAVQVKEKFGGLRFYTAGCDEYQRGAIDFAERLSEQICETCGKPGELCVDGFYYSTKCTDHRPDGAVTPDEHAAMVQNKP